MNWGFPALPKALRGSEVARITVCRGIAPPLFTLGSLGCLSPLANKRPVLEASADDAWSDP